MEGAISSIVIVLISLSSVGQVVINEVMNKPPTSTIDQTFQSLKVCSQPTYGAEYIELYNPDPCTPADIGCYMIGFRVWGNTTDGTFRFPAGTTIPPLGFVSIGGPISGATFDMSTYCGDPHLVTSSDRWYLDNGDAYVALYDNNGTPIDVVFWTTGTGQAGKWTTDSDLDEGPSNIPTPSGCPAVGSLPGPGAIPMAVVNYGGASPAMGQVIHRIQDGDPTWSNTGSPSINDCNGTCATSNAFTFTHSITHETCSGDQDGIISIDNINGGVGGFSYTWSTGATSSSITGLAPGSYDLTIIDNGTGCQIDTTFIINAGAVCCAMTNTVSSTNPVCSGVCDGSITLTQSMGAAPVQYSIDGGVSFQSSGTFSGLCAGSYDILIEDNTGCQYIDAVIISEPTPVNGVVNSTVDATCGACDGEAYLSASGGTAPYTYDIGNGPQSSGSFPGLCAGSYTATIEDSEGCQFTIPLTIADLSGLSGNITSQTDASCFGACDGTVNVEGTGSTAPYTYDIGTGTQASGNFTSLCTGAYTVTITDNNGCVFPVAVNINEPTALSGSIVTQTDVSCPGLCDGAVSLSASSGTAPYTYNIGTGPQPTGDFNSLCTGSYNVLITDDNGCTFNIPFTINEPNALTGSIANQTDIDCNGNCNGELEISASGGITPYIFDIGSGGQTSGTFSSLCAGGYTIIVTDSNGCNTSVNATINEPTAISLVTSNTSSSCGQSDGSVEVIVSGGVAAVDYVYVWEDSTPSVVGTTANISGLASGTYTVTVTDDNGCVAITTETIMDTGGGTATANATSNYNGEVISCSGSVDGQITVTMTGGTAPFTYDIGNGPQIGDTFGSLGPGSYTITVTDDAGCVVNTSITLVAPDPVAGSAITTDETCIGDCTGSITLSGSGGTPPYQYTFDGGANFGTSTSLAALCANAYNVGILDANNCPYFFNTTVNGGALYAEPTIDPIGALCENGASVGLTATPSGGTWSGSGVTGSNFSPGHSGAAGVDTIYYSIAGACGATDTLLVTVNPLPTISFTADTTSGCEPMEVMFTNTGDSGNCLWDLGDGNTSTNCDPISHTYENAGVYDVSLSVVDVNGCSNSLMQSDYISVFENPVANYSFGPQPTTILDSEISFQDLSTGAIGWYWDFAGVGSSSEQYPVFDFNEVGNFYVTQYVTSIEGCIDSITQYIEIKDEPLLYVPNAFSPDGNGDNDQFLAVLAGELPVEFDLMIFNRWGELIFRTNDYNMGWDGTYKGVVVQEDVYVWRIITKMADTSIGEYKGHVTLLK